MKNYPENRFSSDSVDLLRRKLTFGSAAVILASLLGVKGSVQDVFADETAFNADRKIEETEAEFSRLEEMVLPQLDEVKSGKMRVMIRAAFGAFESNKTNPAKKVLPQEAVPRGKENGFTYMFCDMDGRSAKFNGVYRIVKLSLDFNPASIGRLSFLAHELVHVVKDNYYRRTIPEHIYETFWSNNFVAVPSEEAEAIAVQLEILNITTGGDLDSIKTGSDRADKFLTKMAEHYFNKDWNNFVAFVEKWYREKGARIFNADLTPAE